MATGVSDFFDVAGTSGASVRVYYREDYSVETNTSTVSITGIELASSWYYGVTYYLDGEIKINNQSAMSMSSSGGTHRATISALNTRYPVAGSMGSVAGIAHAQNGTGSTTIEISIRGYTRDGSAGSGWSASGSVNVKLTTIPRASEIGATDADIESKSTIVVYRKSDSYTHTIQYVFGNLSGYITASGGVTSTATKFSNTTIAWTIPKSFYNQIPNAKTGMCTLKIKTYSGSTQIGSEQTTTLKVTAAQALCLPLVSGSVEDVNEATVALTGDSSGLIKFYSTALCTIAAQAVNGATISDVHINGVNVTGSNTLEVASVELDSFSFTAVDSRGYSSTTTVAVQLVSYVKLTSNPTVYRPQPTTGAAVLTLQGDYFNGSFGAKKNRLTAKYRISSGAWQVVEVVVEDNTYHATVELADLAYTQAFQFEITVEDALSSVARRLTLKKGIPVFDWGEDDFVFHVPLDMSGKKISGLQTPTEDGDAVPLSHLVSLLDTALATKAPLVSIGSYAGDLNSLSIPLNSVAWIAAGSCTNCPTGNYAYLETWGSSSGSRFQRLTTISGPVAQRIRVNGAWTEWEWINPPMTSGVEYRTTERWNAQPVYCMTVNCGALTSGRKLVEVAALAGCAPLSATGYVSQGSSNFTMIPSIYSQDLTQSTSVSLLVNTQASTGYIQLWGGSGFVGKNAYVQLKYYKV